MSKIINILLSGLLWKRYKFLIVSLLMTIICMVIIGQVHADYIAFQNIKGDTTFLGMSFVIKWLAWMAVFVAFLGANHAYNTKKEREDMIKEKGNSALSRILSRRFLKDARNGKHKNSKYLNSGALPSDATDNTNRHTEQTDLSRTPKSNDVTKHNNTDTEESTEDDPFANIRQKKTLQSYADVVINKNDSDKTHKR